MTQARRESGLCGAQFNAAFTLIAEHEPTDETLVRAPRSDALHHPDC